MGTIRKGVAAGRPLSDEFVVDVHAHIGPWSAFFIPAATVDRMLATMDRLGTNMACVSACEAIGGDYERGNDEAGRATLDHPDRFLSYVVINPHYADQARAELDRCFAAYRVAGIKLHPGVHGVPVTSPLYEHAWAFAEERNCPVLVHSWGTEFTDRLCSPGVVGRCAERFPSVPIILGHAGGSQPGCREAARVARDWPNIYLDTCGWEATDTWLETLAAWVGAERILFGTDFPFLNPFPTLGRVGFADISDEDKRNILGLNAARVFGLRPG